MTDYTLLAVPLSVPLARSGFRAVSAGVVAPLAAPWIAAGATSHVSRALWSRALKP